jgi:RND family efflux transporter MFP subunit
VTVSHPEVREIVEEDEYTGWLAASATVDVRSRVRGPIKAIHFHDGDLVSKDQLLFEIDPDPFLVQVQQSEAQARALEAQKAAAQKDVARFQELVKTGGASRQQLEKAEADALSYDAQIAAKQEDIKGHQLNLGYCRITAAIAGRIGRAQLTEGNLVNAGGSDPVLTTIVAVDPISLYFNVDERSLQRYQKSRLKTGEKAQVKPLREEKAAFRFALDSDEGFPHTGLLDFANNKVDSATGTIELRGTVENDQRRFIAGSRVRVRLPIGEPAAAMLVRDSAIQMDQDAKYLLVLGEGNKVLRREVKVGRLLDDGMRVVLPSPDPNERIKPEDWVITLGLQRARVGYPVEPLDAEGKPAGTPAS